MTVLFQTEPRAGGGEKGWLDAEPEIVKSAGRCAAMNASPTQQKRIAAFRESIADVHASRLPERGHLVEMEAPFLDE